MNNLLKIKAETQTTYEKADIRSLKVIIFLTKIMKNLHTKNAVFIATMIVPLATAIFFYCTPRGNMSIFVVAMISHFIIFKFMMERSFKNIENDYREQECIQETLEEMLKNKNK